MKALPNVSSTQEWLEALRGVAILPGPRSSGRNGGDGDGHQDRGRRRLRPGDLGGELEAIVQAGVLDGRRSGSSPAITDPHRWIHTGRLGAEAVAHFDLAPRIFLGS